MKKKNYILLILIIIFFVVVISRVCYLNIGKHKHYKELLDAKTEIFVEGTTAPRGKILDRNGKVIVDNIGVKAIYFNKLKGISSEEEIKIAYQLAKILTLKKEANIETLKKFWLILNNNGKDLITEEEYQLVEERKLSKEDINKKKYKRITDELLNEFSLLDKKAAYIYSLMNKGYSYEKKLILEDVNDQEYALVIESNIKGITGEMNWKRIYPYGETLKGILGSIGTIPEEKKNEYLNKGYSLSDIVGISYLENYYEECLKGEKALYKVRSDNTLEIINQPKIGNDLVLGIDIDIQKYMEDTIKENIIKAKRDRNTEYYKESYVVISEPSSGEIVALSGLRILGDVKNPSWQDVTNNIITSSYTVGSVVKAASITVGYQQNIISAGTRVKDSCVKLYLVPEKCSYKSLGVLDDIGALRNSSNYYQFLIAIGVTGNKYKYNMKLNATKEHFDIYRKTFASFGLGVKTGIDLPNEQTGIIGNKVADDLLLNLAIGQYDTYTPIELVEYINTVANSGNKITPMLMSKIVNDNKIIKENNHKVIETVKLEPEYFKRIKTGLNEVTTKGTGRGHINIKYNPAGKTGTSESFYDSNGDGKADVETISSLFVGFAPFNDPKYSIVVISPHVSHNNGKVSYKSKVNRYITSSVTDFLFENY